MLSTALERAFDIIAVSDFVTNLSLWQLGTSLGLCALSFFLFAMLKRVRPLPSGDSTERLWRGTYDILTSPWTIWFLLQWVFVAVCRTFQWPTVTARMVASLLSTWLIVRIFSGLTAKRQSSGLFALVAFFIAGLSIVGVLEPTITVLDEISMEFGSTEISLWSVLKGGVILLFTFWVGARVVRTAESQMARKRAIEPYLQALVLKALRVLVIVVGGYLALKTVGMDLTSLAIFGGAIGLGIGFGLQKVVSNLICGVILLLDRSIKPGDVIGVNGTYGEINKLSARYVSVRTRSGQEHLIPNETFVTSAAENWSHTDNRIRLSVSMRAPLDADVEQVMQLMLEAAKDVPRVLTTPEPGVRLKSFGEYAILFELRVWIDDPWNGVSKVKSDININMWHLFRQHNIEIPYPTEIFISKSAKSKS